MGIGIGIFLGLVFIGTVYLFTQTKGSWNWKSIWKKVGIGFAIVIALPIVVALIYWAYSSFTDYLSSRPKEIKTLHGLTLGEKLSDVQFKIPLTLDPKAKWDDADTYNVDNQRTRFLGFSKKDNKLVFMSQTCFSQNDKSPSFEMINGIKCGDTADDIFEKYGKSSIRVLCEANPDEISIKYKFTLRVYDSVEHGIRHQLINNEVTSILITKPEELNGWIRKTWYPCDEIQQKSNKN
jgi:hypothetical protein